MRTALLTAWPLSNTETSLVELLSKSTLHKATELSSPPPARAGLQRTISPTARLRTIVLISGASPQSSPRYRLRVSEHVINHPQRLFLCVLNSQRAVLRYNYPYSTLLQQPCDHIKEETAALVRY